MSSTRTLTTARGTRTSRATAWFLVPALAAVLAVGGCAGGTSAADEPAGSSAEAGTRTVETAFGTVDIPADPQRVVALEGGAGPLLEAGIVPVATADGDWAESYLPEEFEQVADLPIVMGADGWDYEKIASLDPDLIVGFVRGGKEEELSAEKKADFDKLSQIAPTVLVRATGSATVKDASVAIASALGAGEDAEATKAEYDARVAEIKETYGDVIAANTFAGLDSFEEVTVYSQISWLGGILADIGAPLPQVVAEETAENGVFLSAEQLGQVADATVVLTEQTVDGRPGPGAEELEATSTYQSLPAVTAGHAYGIRYFFADRYSLALDVLDQLEVVLKDLQG
ncbi:ABC transporter substrate-binding protein [Oerskovia turbata]|nr:ABC transporter substrate-binding protein [Oerskovia turbata]